MMASSVLATPLQPPSLLRVIAAKIINVVMPAFIFRGIVWLLLEYEPNPPGYNPIMSFFSINGIWIILVAMVVAIITLACSLLHWLVLHRWITDGFLWNLVSMYAMAGLFFGGYALHHWAFAANRYACMVYAANLSARYQIYSGIAQVDGRMLFWTAVSGAVVGLLCGLIFGLIQSRMLKNGRWRWSIATAITWMIVWAGIALIDDDLSMITAVPDFRIM